MLCKVMFKGGGVPDSRFNKRQLEAGTRVEKEHTSNPCLAKQIAKGHLLERKDYYTQLKKAKL